jgi:NAD(P)-dependent dehydrogenase (short-subunit alcohol dehydrogenase family)
MEESDWDVIMEVHLKGHYNCTRPLVRYIRDTNRSDCRIINMSSVSGLFGNFGQVNYGAAKEGIAGFTRSLALEVAKYKCTVNTISPGAATRLTIDLIEAAGRKYDENDWTQGPEQIAPVVAWLCTDAAKEVTSQIIHSQGGILGIMQQPAIIKSFTTDDLWSLDQLDSLIPELVETRKFHDEEVAEKGAPKKV